MLVISVRHLFLTILTVGFLLTLPTLTHAEVTPGDPNNFITTWDTENEGTSDDNQITIPHADGETYDYDLYWVNIASSTQTGTTTVSGSDAASSPTLTFPEPGIYEIHASGTFPHIRFNNGGDKDKILTVEQWGNIQWTSMERAFNGTANLRIPATDAPDLSGVTSMWRTFQGATSFNDPIDHWDVSNVTGMGRTFYGASSFNQPLNNWETSSLTDMWRTFEKAASFNQPLNNWDVSNVTRMLQTFKSAESFNQPLDQWDTASVTTMVEMFAGCCGFSEPPFDQDISNWNFESIEMGSGWRNEGLNSFLRRGKLSQKNLDALLVSMASQDLNNDIPLHLGLKTYTNTGAVAIRTLENLGWDITEQYQVRYRVEPQAVLSGENHQRPLNHGATTTPVTVIPNERCTFEQWSDGNTDNPRTDTITNNLTVTAEIHCPPRQQASASSQIANLEDMGRTEEAAALREEYADTPTTSPALEDTLNDVRTITEQPLPPLDPVRDRETIQELIKVLLELVEVLMQLLTTQESER